ACRDCPREVAVYDLVAGKEIWRLRSVDLVDAHPSFSWLDARRLLFMLRPAMGNGDDEIPPPRLAAIDVTTGARETLLELEGGYLSAPAASRNGKRVALADPSRRSIVV